MFNLAMELYREINFSHSESWGNKKRKRWKETFEITTYCFTFCQSFQMRFLPFQVLLLAMALYQASIYINLNIPYIYIWKRFYCNVVKCLIQFVTSDTYMYNKAFTQCLSPIYIVCLFPWQFLFLPAGLAIPKPWWQ